MFYLVASLTIVDACRDNKTLDRKVSIFDSQLDLNSLFVQIEYVTKIFINYENMYSRFIRGNKASIDSIPTLKSTCVSEHLIKFLSQCYFLAQDELSLFVANNQKYFSCAFTI